jgi:NAD(P)-dependent dehydrogenase (short-subunit alcohol dehydrogenase family)
MKSASTRRSITNPATNSARAVSNPIRRNVVPMKRGGTPEEIADAILFVASDKASYITGQIIRVNGGKTAS